jgi:phosphopantetheine--protein transferase-like protein
MTLGVGVDIIAIARMREIIDGPGRQPFLKKVFTPDEVARAEAHSDPVVYFAKTFAAKEAIFKTFSIDWESGVQFNEIDVTDGQFGEPVPILSGRFAALAAERNATRVHLSLSYDGDYAIAMAVLSSGEPAAGNQFM